MQSLLHKIWDVFCWIFSNEKKTVENKYKRIGEFLVCSRNKARFYNEGANSSSSLKHFSF